MGLVGDHHIQNGRLSKLISDQCILHFIFYMERDNVSMYDTFVYNWSKSVVCDDVIFIASYIKDAIGDEIWWPTTQEQIVLNTNLVEFQGCIGLVYGTLINICKPWNYGAHKVWLNGQKKTYSMNNIMLVDHRVLFIYLDFGYPSSYHDVTILH